MQYIQNCPISCPYCGAFIKEGQERQTPMRNGDLLVECVWKCGQCGMCARRDEKVIKKVVEKSNEQKDQKK